ncbi:MAG: YdcF family protein [Eubacterium sp.]|nr:YdcF family protein [Eubacterium sp.]
MALWIALFVFLGVLLIMIGINVYVRLSANAYIADTVSELPSSVDAIIVPGAGLDEDGNPGVVLQDRLDAAIRLYQEGISKRILMSGDHRDDYHNEVKAMKDYAVNNGIPEEAIFMDHAGFSTYDTMYRAKAIYLINSCVIVTQNYHLQRSVYIARGLGMDAWGYPSKIRINELKYFPLEAREFLARIKEFFVVMFKPQPEVLGDPIPITGTDVRSDE